LSLVFVVFAVNSLAYAEDYANTVYSNVRLVKKENDLVGLRIQIIQSSPQKYVLVQFFEGVAQAPCLAKMKVDEKNFLQFDLPEDCSTRGFFKAKFGKNTLIGGFENGITGPNGEVVMTLRKISAQ